MRRPARRGRRGRNSNARGSVAVEFLFAIPIVLFLFFGIFELGRHYYTRLTLRHAVAEAARFAVTGRTLDDPNTGNPMTRAESIQLVIQRSAQNLGVDVAQIVIIPADGGGRKKSCRWECSTSTTSGSAHGRPPLPTRGHSRHHRDEK